MAAELLMLPSADTLGPRRDRITVSRESLSPYQAAQIARYEFACCDRDGLIYKVRWETWDNRPYSQVSEYASTTWYYETLREAEAAIKRHSTNCDVVRADLGGTEWT